MGRQEMPRIDEQSRRQVVPLGQHGQSLKVIQVRRIEHDNAADRVLLDELGQTVRMKLDVSEEAQSSRMAGLGCHLPRQHTEVSPQEDVRE